MSLPSLQVVAFMNSMNDYFISGKDRSMLSIMDNLLYILGEVATLSSINLSIRLKLGYFHIAHVFQHLVDYFYTLLIENILNMKCYF